MIALIVLVIWAGMSLFKGIDLGGTGHATSPGIIDEYKARKIKMEKMEQLQANLEFVCKHEEKPELLHKKPNNSIITPFITTCIICGRASGAMLSGMGWHAIIVSPQ